MFVSINKSPVLGLDLCKEGYALGMKYMGNLHKVSIFTDLKGLQLLLGKFMYVSAHVSRYKQRVHTKEKLLMCIGEVLWTVECMQALNDLHSAWNRVNLVSVDPYGVLLLYPFV